MPRPGDNPQSLGAFAPTLVLLLVCLVINYVDRGNLSVAAPLLSVELHLTSSQLGALFAAFFITYTAMQFVVGWLVDHFEVNWILIAGFSLWSVATATTGLVRGFVILFGIRLILGIGESVALPASSKILAQHLSETQRGFASGALMSALRCGSAVGTFGTGFLMAKFGWRPIFIGVGLVSLLWLPAWIRWMPEKTFASTQSLDVGFAALLRQRSFWGTCAGHFSCNYLFYFMITWLPTYLVRERHLSMITMTWVAGLYYSVDALSAIASGWLQDRGIRRGHTTTLVRKSAMALGLSIAAVATVGCSVAAQGAYLPWLLAAGIGCGMTGPGLFTFPQTLAGAQVVGRWYGWQNGIANLAGIVGPFLTGLIVQWTGNFRAPFWITASLCIAGGFSWVFAVERVEQVRWSPIGDVLRQPNLRHSESGSL